MKHPTTWLATIAAMIALLATLTSTAAALPELHVLSGASFPVTMVGKTSEVAVNTALFPKVLQATEAEETLEWVKSGSLGNYVLQLKGAESSTRACWTEGSAEGTVVISGEAHLVWVALEPLTLALLYLTEPVNVKCGTSLKSEVELNLTGRVLGGIEGVTTKVFVTGFKVNVKCTGFGGEKPVLKEYFNDEAKLTKATLKVSIGDSETACEEASKVTAITANKSIEFLF